MTNRVSATASASRRPLDRLKVTVHRAAGLRAADRASSDPFAEVFLAGFESRGSSFFACFACIFRDVFVSPPRVFLIFGRRFWADEAVGETAVIKATLEPSWEEAIELLVPTRTV